MSRIIFHVLKDKLCRRLRRQFMIAGQFSRRRHNSSGSLGTTALGLLNRLFLTGHPGLSIPLRFITQEDRALPARTIDLYSVLLPVIGIFSHEPFFRVLVDVAPVKPIVVIIMNHMIVKPSLPDLLPAGFMRKPLEGSDKP